jgi:hypothetical protein
MSVKPENMIGVRVDIVDKQSPYYGHWGYIKLWDGNHYHVSGGSFSSELGEITPVFDRDEFKVPRNIDVYKRMGAVTKEGEEIKKEIN